MKPMISPELSVNTTFSERGPGSLPWLYNLTVTPTPPLLADARNLKAKEVVVSIGLRDKQVSPADQLAMVERLRAQSKAQVFAVVNPKGDHYTFDPSQVSWWILGGNLSGKTQNQILKPEVNIK